MQYACAVAGALEALERWEVQPTIRIDNTKRLGRVRYWCFRVTSHFATRVCWYVAVAASTLLCLAVQPMYDMGHTTYTVFFSVQVFLLAFFWLRMVCHMFVAGLVGHQHAFLHSFWNCVELIVNIFGILQLTPRTNGIRWMRAVSAARPLYLLFVRMPIARLAIAPAARYAPALVDVAITFIVGWVCLSTIGTLVLRYVDDSRCYVTTVLQPGSAFDSTTLPALVSIAGNRDSSVRCGIGRACASPAPGFVDVQCIHLSPQEQAGLTMHQNVSALDYFFAYRNLGTALLATLSAASVDALTEEIERWMVLRGSGAALFPVATVILLASAASAFLGIYAAAFAAHQRPLRHPARRRAAFSAMGTPQPAPSSVQGRHQGGGQDADGTRTHTPHDTVSSAAAPGMPTRATEPTLRAATVSVGTQTAGLSKPLGRSVLDELSASPRDHDSVHTQALGGVNPFSLDEPDDAGPFVLSCTEEHSPDATAHGLLAYNFFGAWRRSGFASATRHQMHTIHCTSGAHGLTNLARRIEFPAFALCHVFFLLSNVVLLAVHIDPFATRAGRIVMQTSAALSLLLLVHALFILLAYGARHFFVTAWYLVEVCGAVTGILELAAPGLFHHHVVCGLRVLRVIPLVEYVSPLALTRDVWPCLVHVALAAVAVVALYTIVGMQLFSDGRSPDSIVQADFRTVWTGLLSTFVAGTGDGWSSAMLVAFQLGRVAPAVLFYISLLFWGFFLSRVVLVSALATSLYRRLLIESSITGSEFCTLPPLLLLPRVEDRNAQPLPNETKGTTTSVHQVSHIQWQSPFTFPATVPPTVSPLDDSGEKDFDDTRYAGLYPATQGLRHACRWCAWMTLPRVHALTSMLTTSALYIVPPRAALRVWLLRVFYSVTYQIVTYLVLLMGVVAVFFETPASQVQSPRRHRALWAINIVYVVVFWLEMLLKCVAFGLLWSGSTGPIEWRASGSGVRGPGKALTRFGSVKDVWRATPFGARSPVPYLCHPLNWLDVGANALSMGGIFYPPLRLGRLLRCARLCTTVERPNRTFSAAIGTLLACVRVVPFVVVLHAVLALLGMSFFSGRFDRCLTDTAVTSRESCTAVDGVWGSPHFHYDHFGHALLSVFAVSVTHRWTPFMTDGMGVGDTNTAPHGTQSGYYVLFFLAVVLLIRFLAYSFVMALLAAHYSLRCHPDSLSSAMVASTLSAADAAYETAPKRQRWTPQWRSLSCSVLGPRLYGAQSQTRASPRRQDLRWLGAEFVGLLAPDSCEPLRNAISRACHWVLCFRVPPASRPASQLGPDAGAEALEWHPSVGQCRSLLEWVCLALTLVVCGFVAASFAYPSPRVTTVFIAFDCVGVTVLGLEVALRLMAYGVRHLCRPWYSVDLAIFALYIVGMCVPSLTFFRALLLFRLVRMAGLSMSLYPLWRRAWRFLNALFVYVILLLIFSVVATQLFGDLNLDGSTLTAKQNFRTVIGAFLMLFTCSTSSNWAELVSACAQDVRTSACGTHGSDGEKRQCGRAYQSVTFFVIFGVVVQWFVVPLCLVSLVDASALPADGVWSHFFYQVQGLWRSLTRHGDLGRVELAAATPALQTVVSTMKRMESDTVTHDSAPKAVTPRRDLQALATQTSATLLARLRLTVDAEGRLAYTHVVLALLRSHWGVLRSDLSWFTLTVVALAGCRDEVAVTAFTRLCERERHTRATAEWLPSETDALLWCGPRHSRSADGITGEDLDRMDDMPTNGSAGQRLRGPELSVPKRTQPLPNSNLFLFNID